MKNTFIVEEQRPPYRAQTPVGSFEWTRGSTESMPLYTGLPLAKAQGAPMQVLDGAVLIRAGLYESQKKDPSRSLDGSELYQRVNTLWIARRAKNSWTVSYASLPDGDESVKLAKEGYDLNRQGKELIMPLDGIVGKMLQDAESRGRVVPALEADELKLDLKSEYARNNHVIAAFGGGRHGQTVAEVHAAYLLDRDCENGYLWELTVAQLDNILPKTDARAETHAVLRPVGLGGGDYDDVDYVYTDDDFGDVGRVRGQST